MRHTPVHFPPLHWACPGVTQKLGFGAMLTFVWSLQAAASSPTASRLGQTMRFPCSRIMCVLPSSLLTIPARADQSAADARPMPSRWGGEHVEVSRHTEDVAASRRCARDAFSSALVARARAEPAQQERPGTG